jgi:hypothetical protein
MAWDRVGGLILAGEGLALLSIRQIGQRIPQP